MVCLSVCLLVMLLSPAKTDEPIEIPFGGLTHMGTRDHVLDGGQDRTNPFAYARGDKSATWPFVKFIDPCLNLSESLANSTETPGTEQKQPSDEAIGRLRYVKKTLGVPKMRVLFREMLLESALS